MPAFHDEEPVEISGHRLTLAIDFKVIDHIEHLVGKTMPEVLSSLMGAHPPVGTATRVIWAMLMRHHPETTQPFVGSALLAKGRKSVIDPLCSLLSRAMNLSDQPKSENSSKVKWSIRDFLVEWVALGGSEDGFWRQTPRSYVVVMEGMARRSRVTTDLSVHNAWHTAIFALSGYAGKLRDKKLSDFLSSPHDRQPVEDDGRLQHARAIHFFQSLSARGVPIEITRH